MDYAGHEDVGVLRQPGRRKREDDGSRGARRSEEHAGGARICEVRIRLEGVSRTAECDVMADASGGEPAVHVREVAHHPKPRSETDREGGRVPAGIVHEGIDLRADVAIDELIEGTDGEMPGPREVVLDAKLADAGREVETGGLLSVARPRWIGRIGR